MKSTDEYPLPSNRNKPLHFKKGDQVLARYTDRLLRGKVLFIYKNRRTAAVVIEKGQHPIVYGTYHFYWFDIYNPT